MDDEKIFFDFVKKYEIDLSSQKAFDSSRKKATEFFEENYKYSFGECFNVTFSVEAWWEICDVIALHSPDRSTEEGWDFEDRGCYYSFSNFKSANGYPSLLTDTAGGGYEWAENVEVEAFISIYDPETGGYHEEISGVIAGEKVVSGDCYYSRAKMEELEWTEDDVYEKGMPVYAPIPSSYSAELTEILKSLEF